MLSSCNAFNFDSNGRDDAYSLINEHEMPQKLTIEQHGATIVAAGTFWEDWWATAGIFQHIQWLDWDEIPEAISDTRGFGIAKLLPESGFESLADVHAYLLQYYTENWLNTAGNWDFVFIELDEILYVDVTRAGFPRFDWNTATHTLVEQEGSHAVVETTVLHGYFILEDGFYVNLYFTIIDGKIDNVEGGHMVAALTWPTEAP